MENSLFPISISQVERTDPINAMEVSKFCVPSTFRQDMQVRAVFRVLCDFGVACQSGPGGESVVQACQKWKSSLPSGEALSRLF